MITRKENWENQINRIRNNSKIRKERKGGSVLLDAKYFVVRMPEVGAVPLSVPKDM